MPRGWLIALGAIALLAVGLLFFPAPIPIIALPAEPVFRLGGFAVTNTMIAAWLTIGLWLVLGLVGTRNMKMVPSGLQNFLEASIEFLLGTAENVAGKENGRRFFPAVLTIFMMIITSNWLGLLPGFGTIGFAGEHHGEGVGMTMVEAQVGGARLSYVPLGGRLAAPAHEEAAADSHGEAAHGAPAETPVGVPVTKEFVPFLRSLNTDLNMTLALGLIGFIFIEYWGISSLGVGTYLSRFFNFKEPIGFFLGLIELVTEFARIISFAFRLFGNVFAGEVLLGVIGFLLPWVAVLPFFALELFVGFIQAAVFAMLVIVFGTLAVAHHGDHPHAEEASHH